MNVTRPHAFWCQLELIDQSITVITPLLPNEFWNLDVYTITQKLVLEQLLLELGFKLLIEKVAVSQIIFPINRDQLNRSSGMEDMAIFFALLQQNGNPRLVLHYRFMTDFKIAIVRVHKNYRKSSSREVKALSNETRIKIVVCDIQ